MQRRLSWSMEREVLYRMEEFERPVKLGTIAGATGLSFGEAGAVMNDFEMLGWVERVGTDWNLTRKGLREIDP